MVIAMVMLMIAVTISTLTSMHVPNTTIYWAQLKKTLFICEHLKHILDTISLPVIYTENVCFFLVDCLLWGHLLNE